uniref:Uncharacterized protein n=1 Tax=Arundo donax TaxID=35708 RepID=A0A0A8ZFE1_ARUDO
MMLITGARNNLNKLNLFIIKLTPNIIIGFGKQSEAEALFFIFL